MTKDETFHSQSLPLFLAWLIALSSSLGALFIGEVMGQAPCDLCWFQRIFMFPLAIILATALLKPDNLIWFHAIPLAVIGWLIAGFHGLLYSGIIPAEIKPCGQGPSCSGDGMTLFGSIPLPFLSLAAFTAIILLLLATRQRNYHE